MPFFQPHKEGNFKINTARYQPIAVNATYNTKGDIRVDYVRFVNPDSSEETLKVTVKSRKEVERGIQFTCLVNHYGIQKEIRLVFYVMEHIWCIEK